MNSRHNYLSISMPCENYGRPPSVVRISAFSDFEATHAKQGYQLSVYGCPLSGVKVLHTKLVLITIILSVTHIIYYTMMYMRGYTIFFSKLRRMTWYGRLGRANLIDIVKPLL